MMNEFSRLHPFVSFLYFVTVIAFSMVFMHPVCLGISFVCSFTYSAILGGRRAFIFNLGCIMTLGVMSIILNPVFNHEGVTVLGYFPDGKPFTLESAIYGLMAAMMIISVIAWFSCLAKIITSDKIMYLFGKIIPSLSLVLSMVLRFIPRLKRELLQVMRAQKGLGTDGKGIAGKLKYGIKVLSIVTTWAFEDGVVRADSMKSRGYGLPQRTAFFIYRFTKRDCLILCAVVLLGGLVIAGGIMGNMAFLYFPQVSQVMISGDRVVTFIAYVALCVMPIITEGWEALRWKVLKSKI